MIAGYDIRLAEEADAAKVADVLKAMDRHYRPDAVLPEMKDYVAMVAATVGGREGTRFALCLSAAGEAVGIACFAVLRPGRDAKGLVFVKDLFVRETVRGQGIGTKLMRFLARFCLDRGIGRIDLGTDTGNTGAQSLYIALGGIVADKVSYSFWTDELRRIAAG
ncbi:MAG: GNAT family N-acetyltransferase [Alphaproteobacteria bacterium]|nr:GNAT family N-acetyltransferase [Alphaproteobacteria bacterium]